MHPELRRLARAARRLARRALRGTEAPRDPIRSLLSLGDLAALPREEVEAACRAAAAPLYLGGGKAVCRLLTRYKVYVDTADVTIGAHLLLEGYWEMWLTRFIAGAVRPGEVAADVGANLGYYSLLLADLVGPEGRVYAVEPNPDVSALLKRSILLNGFAGRTRIVEAAAGAADGGTATLWVPDQSPGGASVLEAAPMLPGKAHEVAVASLDSMLAAENRVDFIKIDAEGSEERIVAGMRRVLLAHRPRVVLEFNPRWYENAAGFLDALGALYGSLNHIDHRGLPVPAEPQRLLAEATEWLLYLDPRL